MIDGTSNTLMLVQTTSEQAVIWTKPEDLTIDPTDPLASIISEKESGFHCCFADGSARLIPRTISTKTLNALLSFAGREVVDEEF